MHSVEKILFKIVESNLGAIGAWAFVFMLLLFTGVNLGYKRYNNKTYGDQSTVTHYIILGIRDTVLFVLALLAGMFLMGAVGRFLIDVTHPN